MICDKPSDLIQIILKLKPEAKELSLMLEKFSLWFYFILLLNAIWN